MYDLLNADGLLVLRGPHFPSYGWRFFDIDSTHNFVTTRANVVELCNEVGFYVISSDLISGIGNTSKNFNLFLSFLRRFVPESFLNSILLRLTQKENLASDIITGLLRLDYLIIVTKKG